MDNCNVSPVVGGCVDRGLQDKGSGVRCICREEPCLEDDGQHSCELGDENVTFVDREFTPPRPNDVTHKSPIKTVETVQTIVESNHVSVVTYIEAPRVGMVFKKWQDIESYYKEYAEQLGFGVCRPQGVYSRGPIKERTATTWRCECWGGPDMRAQREAKKRAKSMDVSGSGGVVGGVVCEDELSRRKRRSKKCGCNAMIYASVDKDGEWSIKKVELEHTHLTSPSKAKLVKEYRMKKFTSRARRKLLNYYEEGVPVPQIHGCMVTEGGGPENVAYTVKDLQHEVYKERRLQMVGGDSHAMMVYFAKMQAGNQNFYHSQRLDNEGRLKDVLWVDARSRAAYEEFGDVVCFDATYLTNKYDLPFVNFVGVNHHGQSILLGCGLVSREDCDTYHWIFKQWLECMNNRAPIAILTDQAAAMRKPLEEVMPSARHRWCIWHIMKKIPEKLGKCKRYKEFKPELKAIVYESFTVKEFEDRWLSFVEEYAVGDNDWLKSLYKERHMWVPAFMKEYFWAGMKTTQRVESINSFFDGFVNRQTQLFEFPQQYSRAMKKRVQDEIDADAKCSKYLRRTVTGFNVEKVFQKLYTDTKFQEVQTECCRMMYCYPRDEIRVSDNEIQYVIEDRVWIVPEGSSEEVLTDRRRFYCATFNTDTKEIVCDCRKFETNGIMCKHIIRILDLNFVKEVPKKYIVNRWRKDILRKHTRVKVSYHDPSESTEVARYNRLMTAFEGICDEAAMVNEETVEMVLASLAGLKAEVTKCMTRKLEQTVAMSYPGDGATTVIPCSEDRATASSVQMPTPEEAHVITQPPPQEALVLTQPPPQEAQVLTQPPPQDAQVHTQPLCDDGIVIKDPIPKKRGRGRPKACRYKTLAEICYKKPPKKKAKKVAAKSKDQAYDDPTNGVGKIRVRGPLPDDVLPSNLDYSLEDDSIPQNSSRDDSDVSATF